LQYVVIPYGDLHAKPMHPNTAKRIDRARKSQLLLRFCGLIGALGALFCVIAINKTSSTVGWVIRVAPAITILHTVYGLHHLFRAATGRTPASTASYMVFAGVLDSGLIPFFVFSAWLANADYTNNTYKWSTLFNDDGITYKIIYAFFVLSCIEAGLMGASLILDIYLGTKFRQIARLPPDMNPLEPNLTSRHKRNKSEGVTAKNMQSSALAAQKDSQAAGFKRVPFIHTRTDSADSVTLYGSESARTSRVDFRKELDDYGKDPWKWSRASSPERPGSALSPSPNARTAGAGLDFRPERSSGLAKETSRPSSWLSYLDYEGVPSPLSYEANKELDHDVRPISPLSMHSPAREEPSFDRTQAERENWYQGSPPRHGQMLPPPAPANGSQIFTQHANASRASLHHTGGLQVVPAPELQPKKRSREPLAMNPPSPIRAQYIDENAYTATPTNVRASEDDMNRVALHDLDGNGQARPSMGSRPSSFVGSGGKARFYGDLRSSIESMASHTDKKDANQISINEVEDMYARTKTLQSESDYSANFEVYESDSDDGQQLRANIGSVQKHPPRQESQWNGVRQTSNSTGYDLNSGYAGLDSEFGRGMGRRREVSGKVAEEGRATPVKKGGAAGWERFKGL
jgi:hypothetical protein